MKLLRIYCKNFNEFKKLQNFLIQEEGYKLNYSQEAKIEIEKLSNSEIFKNYVNKNGVILVRVRMKSESKILKEIFWLYKMKNSIYNILASDYIDIFKYFNIEKIINGN